MLKLVTLTAVAIFTAEALVMLLLEALGRHLSLPIRVLLDSSLLMICVFPTLYFLVFREMTEQIRLRHQAEQTQAAWNKNLELMVEERTTRLQRANEDLFIEVQERSKAAMALRAALNEARQGKEQLRSIIDAMSDALVVVDEQWRVQIVNQAAEAMFRVSCYDLRGRSLKDLLRPWAPQPTDLELFFCRGQDNQSTFLTPPEFDGAEQHTVQMRFGAELVWEGRPATILMFSNRQELALNVPKVAHLP